MNDDLIFQNLLNWSLQIAALTLTAAVVPALLRMAPAKARLFWLQSVLALCVLVPLIRPWKQDVLLMTPLASGNTVLQAPVMPPAFALPPIATTLLLIGLGGILMRLLWLATGFIRLRRHRQTSVPLEPASTWGVEADIRVSPHAPSPVTFGFRRPVVLLPATFAELEHSQREAVLCHEIMHVRRHDWLWMVAEELIRSIFWFHPGIWWLTGEIQLAREQVVDGEVVALTRTKDDYVDALLRFADTSPNPLHAPVPAFLRRHHLKHRVINILKEVHMSRARSVSTALAAVTLLAASGWYTSSAFQLNAAPQTATDAPGVAVDTSGTELLHRAAISYPRSATGTQAEGTVVAQVKLDAAGNVADASIISGPDELRKPVLQSLLNWHFARSAGGSTRQVSITFHSTPEPAAAQVPVFRTATVPTTDAVAPTRVVKQIDISGLPESARQELSATLPVHPGDTATPGATQAVAAAAKKYDEHLTVQSLPLSATEQRISIAPAGAAFAPRATGGEASVGIAMAPIRIGGNVAQTKLLQKVNPAYPPEAKAARIQGLVKFEVIIDKAGTIKNINVVSGPPMLVQAAMQAVQQWVYQPTLLNGNPVEVATVIDVNFTLSDSPQAAQ